MKTILIAEDTFDFREMLRHFLEANGYRTLEATDGAQAVEVATCERPDLIPSDITLDRQFEYEAPTHSLTVIRIRTR